MENYVNMFSVVFESYFSIFLVDDVPLVRVVKEIVIKRNFVYLFGDISVAENWVIVTDSQHEVNLAN